MKALGIPRTPSLRNATVRFALIALLASSLPTPALAVDKFWQTEGGDWNVDANWNPIGVPTAPDNIFIVDNKTANITSGSPTGHQLYVGATFDYGGTTNGTGVLNQTGGDLRLVGAQSWFVIADKPGESTYNMSGGTLFVEDDFMTVGQNGTGVLNMSNNAAITTRGLIFGRWRETPGRGTGTLRDNASITTGAGGFTVGQQGIGTFNQLGGNVNIPAGGFGNWMFVGREVNGNGTYNMEAGTLNAGTRIQVGQDLGSTGTFNLSGGNVTVGTNMSVGDAGTGTLNVTGGTLNVNNEGLIIGAWRNTGPAATPPVPPNPPGNGTLRVSGAGVINANHLRLARGAPQTVNEPNGGIYNTGLVEQTGGAINVAIEVSIGTGNALSNGTYTQSGGTLEAGQFRMALDGATGTYNLSNGTVRQRDVADIADGNTWNYFGAGATGKATFNVSGGTLSMDSRTLLATSAGAGADVNQTGGVFEVRRGELAIGDQGNSTYNITAGTLRTLNPENGNTDTAGHITVGQWDNSNGRLVVGGTGLVEAAANLQIADGQAAAPNAGTVTQTGGTVRVGVAGAGNLTMARETSGTAAYNLSGGVLDLTGGDITRGLGTATFNMTGGELRDVRSTNFPLDQAGGTLHPSDADGNVATMTVNGNYTQAAPATLLIDLGTGTASDVLDVNGNALLAGALALNVLDNAFVPEGTTFTILTPDALTGTFNNGEFVIADTGQPFRISYTAGDGNDVAVIAQIPEPAALAALALALVALHTSRRPRRGS